MTPWARRILIANIVVFFLTSVNPGLVRMLAFVPHLGDTLLHPWTPVTYMFVHAGIMHIGFNMLVLFFFGPRLEMRLGARNFLWLYFASGLGGAALHFLSRMVGLAFGIDVLMPIAPVVGASGATYGIMLAFAWFWPREMIYIWGVLPVQARWLVAAMTVVSLLGIRANDGIAHFAHLGGFAAAFLFLKLLELRSPQRQFKKRIYAHVAPSPTKDPIHMKRWQSVNREGLHEVNRAEFDRLMSKLQERGISSLTLDERAFLDRCANY